MADETRDTAWYAKNRGLATRGHDILTLTNEDVSVAEIEAFFGPKLSKNGYRYNVVPCPQDAANVLELYKRVTGRQKVLNNTINQQFSRAVIAWLKGGVLDWAKYAVHCNNYVTDLRQTKSINRDIKENGTSGPQQLLSKRKQAPRTTPRPLTAMQRLMFKASDVKLEQKAMAMPSLLISASKVIGGPQWEEREILELRDLLTTLQNVSLGAKKGIAIVEEEHAFAVAAYQVCKMHLEGRQTMSLDSEAQRLDLVREIENLVRLTRCQGEGASTADSVQHAELGHEINMSVDVSDPFSVKMQDLQRKLHWAENSQKVAMSMLSSGHQECERTKAKMEASLRTVTLKKKMFQHLVVQIACVEHQLQSMSEGDGLCYYPQPTISNPAYVEPIESTIEVNDCPICGLGFEFRDIIVGSCGHTYHLACLNWHMRKSLCCKLESCKKPFHANWLLSVGIRPLDQRANFEDQQKRRKAWMRVACPQVSLTETKSDGQKQELLRNQQKEYGTSVSIVDCAFVHGAQNEQSSHSSFGSKPNVGTQYIVNPEAGSVTKSAESLIVASVTCSVCHVNLPDIKFQGCGHATFCYVCVMQKPPKVCPICLSEVNGWSRTLVAEVTSTTSPLPVVKPKESFTLKVSSAFDTNMVPQHDHGQLKKGPQAKPKPLKMDIFGGKETLLDSESEDSDSHGLLQSTLVHYPPRPIIHRDAKHGFAAPLSFDSEASESEPDVVPDSQDPLPLGDFAAKAIATIVGKGTNGKDVALSVKQEALNLSPLLTASKKQRKNPLDPNPGCEKRMTRATDPAEMTDAAPKKASKKLKRKKQEKVKSFNYWS